MFHFFRHHKTSFFISSHGQHNHLENQEYLLYLSVCRHLMQSIKIISKGRNEQEDEKMKTEWTNGWVNG